MNKALLLVAHGSRRESSNDEVRQLTEQLAQAAMGKFDFVSCAFLELAQPSIPDGIQQCIDQGAKDIVILPYFLSAGRHVVEDIPAEIKGKQEANPDVSIRTVPYLGSAEDVVGLLIGLATG